MTLQHAGKAGTDEGTDRVAPKYLPLPNHTYWVTPILYIFMGDKMTWVDVDVNNHYEILNTYPYTVRNKRSKCELMLQPHRGYYRVQLQKKRYFIHKLAFEAVLKSDFVYNTLLEHNADTLVLEAYRKTLLQALRESFKHSHEEDVAESESPHDSE